ncbi:hypothetical protein DICPUDRAFT_75030 [Dictyostelium purpureum]|uniref:TRAF-type domain-containing protein n=1 Tax=Dictyostelium purpureum TaxID=5786 RepID=F0Z9F6_DICPU|nr:uncharacterized protein DICPUDRAFT_75030 [Dictyostelium purpureum]EGC39401.1 hypothetical protein DICPUDRAFT_75030 [Dictyostelium purpureum]|eukprot:XP_003284075.1 hypothetical protein DICPUDRAFT_75030 [Dictyostelium purpureum]
MGQKHSISLNKHYTITDLLMDKRNVLDNRKYECSICLELLYNKQVFQCREGHYSWTDAITTSSKCPVCRVTVKSIEELSRNRFVEEEFAELQVVCPFLFSNILDITNIDERVLESDEKNGCKKIMKAGELEEHLKKCEHRYVNCLNSDCPVPVRSNETKQHAEHCDYSPLECIYCSNKFTTGSIEKHYLECQNIVLSCEQCCTKLKRSELSNHIDNECPNSIVFCKYKSTGCLGQFKRTNEATHLNEINHTVFMTKYICGLEKKLEESNVKNEEILKTLSSMLEQLKHNNSLLKKE